MNKGKMKIKKKERKKRKALPLLTTLKEKRHYLVLITKEEWKKIDNAILEFLGTFGYAKAGPLLIEKRNKEKNRYYIVSIVRKEVPKVKAALALAGIKCIGVSGTIKKARKKYLQ